MQDAVAMFENPYYIIVAVPFYTKEATHEKLMEAVNKKMDEGYDVLGAPFFGEEMMYQAMKRK
jgi:hypothetical protein